MGWQPARNDGHYNNREAIQRSVQVARLVFSFEGRCSDPSLEVNVERALTRVRPAVSVLQRVTAEVLEYLEGRRRSVFRSELLHAAAAGTYLRIDVRKV